MEKKTELKEAVDFLFEVSFTVVADLLANYMITILVNILLLVQMLMAELTSFSLIIQILLTFLKL